MRAAYSFAPATGRVPQAFRAGLFAVAPALLSSCDQDGGGLRVAFTTTAGNADRAFVDPPDSLVMLLGRPPHGLGHPTTAKVSTEGDIYVADFGNSVVRQFDPDGDFVRDYGAGRGEGPGEFQALVDALDSLLFRRLSADGSTVLAFGELLEREQRANAIAATGEFAPVGDYMVWTGTYGGVLASWSAVDGSTRYIRPTVVKRSFPVPVTRGNAVLIAGGPGCRFIRP